jgi:hypothetical protein
VQLGTQVVKAASEPAPKRPAPASRRRTPPPAPPAQAVAAAPRPLAPAAEAHGRGGDVLDVALRLFAGVYLVGLLVAVVAYKAAFARMLPIDPYVAAYGLVVAAFIVSRFVLSVCYRPARDAGLEPHVAIVMPAFNEEEAIAASIRSLLVLDYPQDKLEVVVVNDGSSDRTLAEIENVARSNPRVQVIDFPSNRGKRAAMAAGIRATSAEVIAFVDSDSGERARQRTDRRLPRLPRRHAAVPDTGPGDLGAPAARRPARLARLTRAGTAQARAVRRRARSRPARPTRSRRDRRARAPARRRRASS